MGKSRMSRACDISPKVRAEVFQRDGGRCIYCGGTYGLQTAHFIPRSQGGLGVAENLSLLCINCHTALDNGADSELRKDIGRAFAEHLKTIYPKWDRAKLIYRRWERGSPD